MTLSLMILEKRYKINFKYIWHYAQMYLCLLYLKFVGHSFYTSLTHLISVLPSYKNLSIDMHIKSIDCFLYDGNTDIW